MARLLTTNTTTINKIQMETSKMDKEMIATTTIRAFGTEAAEAPLQDLNIKRRKATPHDVEIEILFCGVCHSDLHTARNEWHGTVYPCIPGHEIVGRVVSVGEHVTKFTSGDIAA